VAGRSAPPPRHSIVAYARWADYRSGRMATGARLECRESGDKPAAVIENIPQVFSVASALERAAFKRSFNGIHETGRGIQETGKWYTGGMLRTITRFLSLTLVS
jgi:hypothetical protein